MKQQYGAPILVRREGCRRRRLPDGRDQPDDSTLRVRRAVVLQGVVTRDAKQSISLITAQKQMVQGGGFDVGKRTFIIDRKDVPRDFVLRKDDWIVFDNRHYDLDTVTEYEFGTAWVVIGKELVGVWKGCRLHFPHRLRTACRWLTPALTHRSTPMSVNPNWARWVFASLATLLKELAEDYQLPVLVEGLDERTTAFMEATDRVEIRITGPFTRDLSNNYYELAVDANALFVSRYEDGKNKYAILNAIGSFQAALDAPIPIFKYGNQNQATMELSASASWSPARTRGEAVRVMHFGQADLTNRIKQSFVDARYLLYLSNDGQPYV